jgi:hypothetical protein
MPSQYKLIPVRPVSGLFDQRSLPDEIGAGSFTLVKNASVRAIGKRCRRGGWTKLLDGVNQSYNNESLADQLVDLQEYYTSYSAFLSGGGDFDHYAYAYYYPSEYIGGTSENSSDSLNHLGNPYGTFPFAFTPNACWVYFYYGFAPHDYYRLMCNESSAGYAVQGYPYGPYEAQYSPEFGYEYLYCGDVPLVRGGCREAITYLAEFRSPRNFRKLLAGTKSRLYSLNERTGNWRILADGLGGTVDPALDCVGCSQRRFLSAQLDSILILSNDFDAPLYYYFDDSAVPGDGSNCDLWSARPIPDLQDLNITKVGCVAQHKGFMFLADVEQDGTYYPHRVIWSDYKNPISFVPTNDSLAGFQDIGSGERILRMEVLGDYLYVYSDQAIHRGSLVSTAEIWNFEQIYRGPDAMKFKFSFVNTGDEHFYLSEDKIMVMTLSDANPLEVPWMRPSSPVIFAGINEFETSYGILNNDACDLVTGGYNSVLKELWWSWPTGDNSCPDVSLVFNLTRQQEAADLVDHGFTAFCVYESDRLPTVADWLIELGVCDRTEMPPTIKEGDPASDDVEPTGNPTCIWNATEDPDLPASDDSLCAALENRYPEDFCKGCVGTKRFVMASAVDRTLKEYRDDVLYREMLESGFYVQNGYDSILRSGSESLRIDAEKVCRGLKVEFQAAPQTSPSTLLGWVGYGAEASCMSFKNLRNVNPDGTVDPGIALRCLSDFSSAQHIANQTRPGVPGYFNASVRGRFLAYQLVVRGTGGAFCISSVGLDVAKAENP